MKYGALLLVLSLFLLGCVDTFSPPETNQDARHLVVSGFMNTGGDTTFITLSRTQPLQTTTSVMMEGGATIQLIGDKGTTIRLTQRRLGEYYCPPRSYQVTEQFKMKISLANGRIYESEFVPIKITPPIDTIGWNANEAAGKLDFLLSTHDPTNNSRYYRWKAEETYEYHSNYGSFLQVVKMKIEDRKVLLNTCWRTDLSSNIMIGTSAKLASDLIQEYPVVTIRDESIKLLVKYSLLVRQYAITQEAYQYWDMLAKSTETSGGLFDPLPSLVTGNFKCTSHPEELIFGFFSAGTETKKRITVTPWTFTGWYPGRHPGCPVPLDTLDSREVLLTTDNSQMIIGTSEMAPYLYYMASPVCVDCRYRGGSLTKPSWF